jgi:hypothetical protein
MLFLSLNPFESKTYKVQMCNIQSYKSYHIRLPLYQLSTEISSCSPVQCNVQYFLCCYTVFDSIIMHWYIPTFVVERFTMLLRIQEVPGFKSRPGDRLFWMGFFVIFPTPAIQIPGYHLKLGHERFFPNSLFTCNSFIWRSIVWVTEKSSLSKLQSKQTMHWYE